VSSPAANRRPTWRGFTVSASPRCHASLRGPVNLPPEAGSIRHPEAGRNAAPVPLAELLDRGNDEIYSARTRLLLYLAIKSRRGQRPVRLTNEMAAEIGLDRRRKCEALRYLESQGRVTVVQVGQHVPWVYLLQTPRPRELSGETDSSSAETDTGSPS
jgi:hypothetical protein